MYKHVNILLLGFVLWQIVYYLFSDPDSMKWSSIFYIIESGFVLYLMWLISDWVLLKKWLLWLIASIYIVRILVYSVGLFSQPAFEYLNKNYLLCLGLVIAIEVWIVLKHKK